MKIAQALALVMFSLPAFAQAPDSATIAAHCMGDADEMAYESIYPALMISTAPSEAGSIESSEAEVVVVGSLQRKDENSTADKTIQTDVALAGEDQDFQNAMSALALLPEVSIPPDADREGADLVTLDDRSEAEDIVGTIQPREGRAGKDGAPTTDHSATPIESPTSPPNE